MAQQGSESTYNKIISKAWSDPAFKQKLLSDPQAAAREFGIVVPPGLEIRVIENTPNVVHLVIPAKPEQDELSERELEAVAGGVSFTYTPINTGAYAPANLGLSLTNLGKLSSGRYGA